MGLGLAWLQRKWGGGGIWAAKRPRVVLRSQGRAPSIWLQVRGGERVWLAPDCPLAPGKRGVAGLPAPGQSDPGPAQNTLKNRLDIGACVLYDGALSR